MQLTINGKDYPIYIGLEAIKILDEMYTMNIPNVTDKYGNGVNLITVRLLDNDPVAITNFIKAGTSTLQQKPSNADLEAYIMNIFEEGKENELCKEIIEFLKKSPLTRKKASLITETIERVMNPQAPEI